MRNGVSLDLNIFKNDVVMTSVENIIRELAASEIYYQVLEDVINRIVVHNVEHDNFVLLDAIERSEWVDVWADIVQIVRHAIAFGLESIVKGEYDGVDFTDMSDVIAIIDILANNKLVVGREAEIFAILFDNLTEISSESAKLDTIDWDNNGQPLKTN